MSRKKQVAKKKQVADFIIKNERTCEKEDRLNNLRLLTFAKDNIEKNVNQRVFFKNYKERFERLLHLWINLKIILRSLLRQCVRWDYLDLRACTVDIFGTLLDQFWCRDWHMLPRPWWGLINEGEKNQLGAIIAKAVKHGFLAPTNLRFKTFVIPRRKLFFVLFYKILTTSYINSFLQLKFRI